MKDLKDPQGEGEFQLQVASKRKLLEHEIKNRTLQLEQAREDARNAFIAANRQAGVRNSFAQAKQRVQRVTHHRNQRRKDLGPVIIHLCIVVVYFALYVILSTFNQAQPENLCLKP